MGENWIQINRQMNTQSYQFLILQLEARFSELGIFCNELPTWVLRSVLDGELMLVVIDANLYIQHAYLKSIKWCKATQKPLSEVFGAF